MRGRIISQVRHQSDLCIFCAYRVLGIPQREGRLRTTTLSVTKQALSVPLQNIRSASTAAALKEDDEDDFPLLKQNAAKAASTFQAPTSFSPSPPHPQPQFDLRRLDAQTHRVVRRPSDVRPRQQRDNRVDRPQSVRTGSRTADGGIEFRNVLPQRQDRQARPRFQASNAGKQQLDQDAGATTRSRVVGKNENLPNNDNQPWSKRKVVMNQETFPNSSARSNRQPDRIEDVQSRGIPSEVSFTPVFGETVRKSNTTRVLDTPKDLNIEVEAEQPKPEPSYQSRFRRNDRLLVEEQEPAAYQPPSRPTASKAPNRGRGANFDFDLAEAEQALNGDARRKKKKKQKQPKAADVKPVISIPEFMTVQQLAQSMKVKTDDLISKLNSEGFEGARFNHVLDAETCAMFADMYGFDPVSAEVDTSQDLFSRPQPEDVSALPSRPPIVTIMGHVDHGKTTILDYLRKASVAAGEAGGITQHIGAFSVTMPGSERQITFLDTPGHEAFLDMRRRGANVTDIVVLVVAADDSVKPQTIEAIKHALQARVQIIVAINKIDKHDANIEQVKQDLMQHDIVVEDYGGDYQAIPVSGKTGKGMDDLEEAIITLADVLDLRAEQDIPAEGTIIESKVTNAGRVATILVRRGILRIGDFIVAGPTWARVRTLRNETGELVKEAYPGDPVQVDGWRGEDPTAGLEVLQADNEQHAKDVIAYRHQQAENAQTAGEIGALNSARTTEAEARAKVLEWERENKINARKIRDNEGWVEGEASGGPKLVHFIVKADVAGSVEAIVAAVSAIGNHEIRANVIHSGTGPVTESDIKMLAATGETGYAISFSQPIESQALNLAGAAGLGILDHNIIYKVTDDVRAKVEDALPPQITQRVLGEAEIGQIFEITMKKDKMKIAGCKISNGIISRSSRVRILRDGIEVYNGQLESLKNVKRDVQEMRKGQECGMAFKEFEDLQVGDQIQCFEEKEEKRKLY